MSFKENIELIETLKINEENENDMNSTELTFSKGLFIKPTKNVSGRTEDVTDMLLVATDKSGKVGWTPITDIEYGSQQGYSDGNNDIANLTETRGLIEFSTFTPIDPDNSKLFTINHPDINENTLLFITPIENSGNVQWDYYKHSTDGTLTLKCTVLGRSSVVGPLFIHYFIIN